MIDKVIEAIEPFALTIVVFAGASLAGWVKFSNQPIVGYAAVFVGTLLAVKHIGLRVKQQ